MAPFAGFIGPTYTGQALAADAERAVNWFPEKIESGGGSARGGWVYLPKPGLQVFATLGTSAVDSIAALNGRCFAVSGATFFEVLIDGTANPIGSVTPGGRVQMCVSQTQVLVLANGDGFIFDLANSTLTQITAAGWLTGATKVAFIDGYFIILEPNTQTFAISGLNDGTAWDALDFGDAEGQPGNAVSFLADHRQLWIMCVDHGEVYYDSGDSNFPFSRLEGAFMEQGIAALDTLLKFDNTAIWLGANEQGQGVVWKANGYTPQRISTHAIEAIIQSLPTIADATAYAYQDGGHLFYVLHFPTGNRTLVYDAATSMWHERGIWNGTTGQWDADLARVHCFAFGKHLAGDYKTGNVYEMSAQYATDNGARIRKMRTAPDLVNGGKWAWYPEFRLMAQAKALDGTVAGSDPKISLATSNDGGFNWNAPRQKSLGKLGANSTLLRWRMLGRSQNRAFQVVCDEPCFVALLGADLDSHG